MSPPEPLPPRPRRRRFAMSVRAVMLLILILGAGLGWMVRRAHMQREAVARIERAGGDVSYDYPFSLVQSSWAPGWLQRLEVCSVDYYLPAESAGDRIPIRTFRYPGVNPNTRPTVWVTSGFTFSYSADGGGRVLPDLGGMPTVGAIGRLTIDEIESARNSAREARDAGMTLDDAHAQWLRLESRDSYDAPWQPAWLRRLIGDEYFRTVAHVSFGGDTVTDDTLASIEDLHFREFSVGVSTKVTDAGLAHLDHVKGLEKVKLSHMDLTDECLTHLAGSPHLHELRIENCKKVTGAGLVHLASPQELRTLSLFLSGITDAGLAPLARLSGLQKLDLYNVPITDTGLAHLAGMKQLRELNLARTSITGAGLVHLKGLDQLQELDLTGVIDLDDAGLAWLEGLKGLRRLGLAGTAITDAGLIRLARLPSLEELDLCLDEITDAGLVHLRGLHHLRALGLDDTRVSASGKEELQKALPTLALSSAASRKFSVVSSPARERRWAREWRKAEAQVRSAKKDREREKAEARLQELAAAASREKS